MFCQNFPSSLFPLKPLIWKDLLYDGFHFRKTWKLIYCLCHGTDHLLQKFPYQKNRGTSSQLISYFRRIGYTLSKMVIADKTIICLSICVCLPVSLARILEKSQRDVYCLYHSCPSSFHNQIKAIPGRNWIIEYSHSPFYSKVFCSLVHGKYTNVPMKAYQGQRVLWE